MAERSIGIERDIAGRDIPAGEPNKDGAIGRSTRLATAFPWPLFLSTFRKMAAGRNTADEKHPPRKRRRPNQHF